MVGKVLERGSKRAACLANNALHLSVGARVACSAPPASERGVLRTIGSRDATARSRSLMATAMMSFRRCVGLAFLAGFAVPWFWLTAVHLGWLRLSAATSWTWPSVYMLALTTYQTAPYMARTVALSLATNMVLYGLIGALGWAVLRGVIFVQQGVRRGEKNRE